MILAAATRSGAPMVGCCWAAGGAAMESSIMARPGAHPVLVHTHREQCNGLHGVMHAPAAKWYGCAPPLRGVVHAVSALGAVGLGMLDYV